MPEPLRCSLTAIVALLIGIAAGAASAANQPAIPSEAPADAKLRHARVSERRKGINIICHRGASEHAHENTLEAFRATFELGGDGNEIDIRATKDGVLVCFHDDMLDRLLDAFGDVSDYTWDELQQFRIREPGRFSRQCRIPTLVEAFELHRQYAGLMHLDIKWPGLDAAIAELVTRMDMWDHVAYCNMDHGGVILTNSLLKLRRYKARGLYENRSEVFPDAIAAALKSPGDDVIVDDPRGVLVALGRQIGKLSSEPISPKSLTVNVSSKLPTEAEAIAVLSDAVDWNQIAESPEEQAASARRILVRAKAANHLFELTASSSEAFAALEERVRNRSLHKDWRYHGLDGAISLRSLIMLGAPNAVDMARFALWRDDPALQPLVNPRWNNPRSFVDWREKTLVFPTLKTRPGPGPNSNAEKLCRDYLALSDAFARQIGVLQFEEAARALLSMSPGTETAQALMGHRLQVVRGRAILDCLTHAHEPWARTALERAAPHALAYRVTYDDVPKPDGAQ